MSGTGLQSASALLPIAIPLAGSALALLLRRWPLLQRSVTEVAVGLLVLASVGLLATVSQHGPATMAFGGWPAPFGVTLVADTLGAALSTTAALIALAVTLYARADIGRRRRRAGFDPLFLAMLAAVNGALLTGDLFNLYVWFELMLVTAVGLMTLDRTPAQVDGAFRYAAASMLGATCLLAGIALLYAETGTLDFAALGVALAGREPTVATSGSAFLLLAGFALKAGLFPLFFWLPASYHTAPVSVMAALAGLLTKVAFYAALRVLVTVFGLAGGAQVAPGLSIALGAFAAGTMLVAVLAAIAQVDIRRLLAFHLLAQVAYLVVGLAVATSAGIAAATFYTVHTMLVQTGLVLGAGAIARAHRGYDVRSAAGLMQEHPAFTASFAMLMLSIAGIPPLSGFWAKLLVLDAAFASGTTMGPWLALVALVTGVLTLYSMSTLWMRGFWRARPAGTLAPRRIPPAMLAAVALMAACTLAIGLTVEPLLAMARRSASGLTQPPAMQVAP